jgi:hypothetical protein
MIAPSISGNYDYRYFAGAVIVVFSNNPPPTHVLSKDKWQIYKIEYNSKGISCLQSITIEECTKLDNNH